ncbi:MAG: CHAD domain-containing protein [Lamprobacter sp.]|uniref:CHAD domain-containing protein n=1 Tax=Lamprobacter sp. TaxID=3100796 RepID=UPI002B25AD1C|nr:CHAD domain-containing protein [Lamprobacter sp.]MEA3639429.1 CHAD domain-containing protein [Lamprobacter sp.]
MQEPVDVLDPGQRADLATKQILRGQLETIKANIEGARQNLDSEYLHDLRVATRRTRSALGQIKEVFPEDVVADFKQRFAWLQQVTGPVRDLDVYLLDFPAIEQRLPPALRRDLQPLYAQLLQRHAEAQRQLASELGSPQCIRLLQDWQAFIDAPVPGVEAVSSRIEGQPDASLAQTGKADGIGERSCVDGEQRSLQAWLPKQAAAPIKQVADQRIRKMLKRVRAEGNAITEQSPPEDLHELRKSCKKLRYLMEFFQGLYPKGRMREQLKQIKLLLDHLGRFQDAAVQAAHLREYAESSAGDHALPPATLLAMGALVGQLLQDQACVRDRFSAIFAGFSSAKNARRFRILLATDPLSRHQRAA